MIFKFNKKTRATGAGLVAPKGIKPLSQVPETCILFVELRSRNIIQSLNRYPRRHLDSSSGVCRRHLRPSAACLGFRRLGFCVEADSLVRSLAYPPFLLVRSV